MCHSASNNTAAEPEASRRQWDPYLLTRTLRIGLPTENHIDAIQVMHHRGRNFWSPILLCQWKEHPARVLDFNIHNINNNNINNNIWTLHTNHPKTDDPTTKATNLGTTFLQ